MSDMTQRLGSNLVPFGHGCHEVVDSIPGLYAFWLRGTCLYVGMTENMARRISEHETAEINPFLSQYFCKFPGEIEMAIAYVNTDARCLKDLESECIARLRPLTNAKNTGGVCP